MEERGKYPLLINVLALNYFQKALGTDIDNPVVWWTDGKSMSMIESICKTFGLHNSFKPLNKTLMYKAA